MRLDHQRSQPRLLRGVNDGGDHWPPWNPHPALLVDSHPRSSGALRVLPADKPLVTANARHCNTDGRLDCLLGVITRKQAGQTPAALGITRLLLRGIKSVIFSKTVLVAALRSPQGPSR